MVGEQGPERVVFNRPGTVIPNPMTQQRMAGEGRPFHMPQLGGIGAGAGGFQMGGGGINQGIWGPFGQPNIPPETGVGGLGGIGTFKPKFGRGWQYGGAA